MSSSLGETCVLVKRGIAPKYIEEGGLMVINQRCVRDHRVNPALARRHDLSKKAVPEERLLRVGDALVNSTGVGTLGRVAQIKEPLPELATVDTHVTIARPKDGLFHADFFGYILILIEDQIAALGAGASGQTELSRTALSDSIVVHYPVDHSEQERIVAALDKAFEAIATATANTEKNLVNARELFESERDRAFDCRTAECRRILLEEACRGFEYGTSTKSQTQGEVPVLRMGNLQDGEIDWDSLVYSADPVEIDRYSLHQNDVLFNRTNSATHVGKSAIFRGEREAIFAGYLIRVNYDPGYLDPQFLNHYLNCRQTREHGRSVMAQSVNQANISAAKLKRYPIALPPIESQRLIAARLEGLKAEVTAVELLIRMRLDYLVDLKQSILQKAFSGELTAVDGELSKAGV